MKHERGNMAAVPTALLVVLGLAAAAAADGFVVPVRPDIRIRGHWAVKYHHVNMRVRNQVASVSIDQAFVNTGRGTIEVEYLFPVPPGAAIDSMTLIVGKKEYAARLLGAEEARRIYEEIVRRKKDPALLEYAGFGLFKTRAFPLQPGEPVRVQVTYKNICRKEGALVQVWYPLNTEKFSAKPIEDVRVTVDIKAPGDILTPYSPTHDITVDRRQPNHLVLTYRARNSLPTQDLLVYYEESARDVGATLVSHMPEADKDGYFMMLASPSPRTSKVKISPKDVIMVLDSSGSMSGQKIRQAKEALRFILKNFNAEDRFNVVVYSDVVEPFYEELVGVSDRRIADALERVDAIDAAGGTNIHDALQTAMTLLRQGADVVRSRYILFLTDGQPTIGQTDEKQILAEAKKANTCEARVFAFGVGYDVNVRLLDKLVGDNHGRSIYVKKDEPVEPKVTALYTKIKNPVMTKLTIRLEGLRIRDMYPRELPDLFEGDQIVLVGRYDWKDLEELPRAAGGSPNTRATQLVIVGTCGGEERGFEYPVTLRTVGKDMRYAFVEKLWATRRVGFLFDQIQLHGKSKEVIDELVRLSMRYGIITPYTSFLADERTRLDRPATVAGIALKETAEMADRFQGGQAQVDAAGRGMLNQARRPGKAKGGFADEEMFGYSSVAGYTKGDRQRVARMRNFSQQAVYQRGRVWFAANAADLDLQRDTDKIQEVRRFSEEYFELVRANNRAENEILASQQESEELVIRLRGQAYRIR